MIVGMSKMLQLALDAIPGSWKPITGQKLLEEYELEYEEDSLEIAVSHPESETYLIVRYIESGSDPVDDPDAVHIDIHWWDIPEHGGDHHQVSITMQNWITKFQEV